jgi:hypothetical protein
LLHHLDGLGHGVDGGFFLALKEGCDTFIVQFNGLFEERNGDSHSGDIFKSGFDFFLNLF